MEVEDLGAFPAGILAVSGSRKIACVVSWHSNNTATVIKLTQVSTSNRIRIYDVDVDIDEDDDV